ncbi:MAG TPA: hypothetical protein VH592_15350 [Gemmataceae bacterium]|jgi:hypothetical protein
MPDDAAKLQAYKVALGKVRECRAEFLRLTEPFARIASFVEGWKNNSSKIAPLARNSYRSIQLEEGLLEFGNLAKPLGIDKYVMQINRAYQEWRTALDGVQAAHHDLSDEDKQLCPLENVSF